MFLFRSFPQNEEKEKKKFPETEKSYWGDWQEEEEEKEKEEERESRKCVFFPSEKIQGLQYRVFTTFTTESFFFV